MHALVRLGAEASIDVAVFDASAVFLIVLTALTALTALTVLDVITVSVVGEVKRFFKKFSYLTEKVSLRNLSQGHYLFFRIIMDK